ncbi:MAG: hypothetical protein M9892_07925 [Bacteroidetes bacterium]|nr:hypothetical protein [Bacteroidota bacterium]
MKKTILLISTLLLIVLQSCFKEKECRELTPILLEQEMLDWVYFKEGSYWIYRDTISGIMDSIYVTDARIDREEYQSSRENCPSAIYDVIYVITNSSLGYKFQLDGKYGMSSGVHNDTTNIRGNILIRNLNHTGGDGGYSLYMFFPVVQGTIGRWASSWTFIKHDTIFPIYEVAGKQYENVLRVHDNANGAYSAETKFYHAKHIGVIKKEIYEMDKDNPNPKLLQVWELTDYKVIQ